MGDEIGCPLLSSCLPGIAILILVHAHHRASFFSFFLSPFLSICSVLASYYLFEYFLLIDILLYIILGDFQNSAVCTLMCCCFYFIFIFIFWPLEEKWPKWDSCLKMLCCFLPCPSVLGFSDLAISPWKNGRNEWMVQFHIRLKIGGLINHEGIAFIGKDNILNITC